MIRNLYRHLELRMVMRMSGASSNIHEENGEDSDEGGNSPEEDGCHQHHQNSDHHEKKAIIGHVEFKLVHFLKGRLSYSSLWCMRKKRTEERPRPSKFVANCLRIGLKKTWSQT